MSKMELNDADKHKMREEWKKLETAKAREERKKIKITDFESLALIGKGAFGEVRLVRQIETGNVYALKTMIKEAMVLKNQVAHVKAERDVLASADDKWIVDLGTIISSNIIIYVYIYITYVNIYIYIYVCTYI